jgi:hypothetical protein
MPFHRNFTYWIDKRHWKYYFLMVALEMDHRHFPFQFAVLPCV